MGRQFKPGQLETGSIYNISSSFAITASYALNAGGTTIDTGSLITTASFNAFTASYTTGSFTGSFSGIGSGLTGLISSSYATTASYVNSLGSNNYTQSFSNSNTWIVTHNLGTQFVIIQTYDSGYDEVIPQNVDLTDANTATITFPTLESGYVVASVGGALSSGNTYNTYTTTVDTGSFATTGSNTFTGNQKIETPDPATNFIAIDFRNPGYGIYGKSNSIAGRGNTLEFTATDYNIYGDVLTHEVLTLHPEGRVGIGTTNPSTTVEIIGDQTISGSLFISGTTEFGGNLVPKTPQGASLGTLEKPFSEIFVSSGSINIASDTLGVPNTSISNVDGNILISAGGMQLVGTGSFNATTGSFQYISGSMTQLGNYTQTGNYSMTGDKVITGSATATSGFTGSLFGTASYALNLPTSSLELESIIFNTDADISVGQGELAWNGSDGTLDLGLKYGDVVLQVGQEQHYIVRNATGDVISNGTAVYASGVTGGSGRIEASPFTADGSVREVRFLGLATHDISNGVNGVVTHFGYTRGLDTRGTAVTAISVGDEDWSAGDVLYAHPTAAGKLTNVPPKHKIYVAIVITRHQNTGVLFVRPSSYGHMEDIHDVNISTGSLSTGDLLIYNSGSDEWQNSRVLSGSYQLTGSLSVDGSITGSILATNGLVSSSQQIQDLGGLIKGAGSWTVTPGTADYSFTLEANNTYHIWILGNIPNGIISYNATVTIANTNVPVVGSHYAWNYTAGNELLFTSIPSQIVGTLGGISTAVPGGIGTTTNTFTFGITNNSATSVVVNYGYVKLS